MVDYIITEYRIRKELSTSSLEDSGYYLDRFDNLSESERQKIIKQINLLTNQVRGLGVCGAVELLIKLGSHLNGRRIR